MTTFDPLPHRNGHFTVLGHTRVATVGEPWDVFHFLVFWESTIPMGCADANSNEGEG